MTAGVAVEARNLERTFQLGFETIHALCEVNLKLVPGEFAVLAGPSGSGKSTLLHCLGGLERPSRGEVWIEGKRLAEMGDGELSRWRRRRVGFVFQSFHLVPVLSAVENVEWPLLIDGWTRREARERALGELDAVGLAHRADQRPERLSGGERQRVAIARATVHRPALLLADEPTGNLDSATARAVLELIDRLRQQTGTACLVATHDVELLALAPRVLRIRDGRIVEDVRRNPPS